MVRNIAIAGIPGAGKTTLARGICEARGWFYLSTGDIARHVDPEGLAEGGLADEALFRAGLTEALDGLSTYSPVVLDGIPRSFEQMELLPDDTMLLGLVCRSDVARDRLLRRGREDDTLDIINKRIAEQSHLLQIDAADSWLRRLAGWGAIVNTTMKRPEVILRDVLAYIDGTKKQAF